MTDRKKNNTIATEKLYAGIDAGSVSLNCIVINHKKEIVFEAPYGRHIGKVDEGVLSLIQGLYDRFGEERSSLYPLPGTMAKS